MKGRPSLNLTNTLEMIDHNACIVSGTMFSKDTSSLKRKFLYKSQMVTEALGIPYNIEIYRDNRMFYVKIV